MNKSMDSVDLVRVNNPEDFPNMKHRRPNAAASLQLSESSEDEEEMKVVKGLRVKKAKKVGVKDKMKGV